jgi:putative flippase GtrA
MAGLAASAQALFARYRPLRFLIVGVFNTCFGYFSYVAFLALGFSVAWASLIALVLGIVWSFTTQGTLVFKNATRVTFVKFTLNWVMLYFVNLGTIYLLMQFKLNAYMAGALATIPVTAISYFSMKYLVFKKSGDTTGGVAAPHDAA